MTTTLRWNPAAAGGWLSDVDWRELFGAGCAIDPYLVWTDLSALNGTPPAHLRQIPLMLQRGTEYETRQVDKRGLIDLLGQMREHRSDAPDRLQLGAARPFGRPGSRPPDAPLPGPRRALPLHILGVIDDGCPFAHPEFLPTDEPVTGLRYLWDQNSDEPRSSPWTQLNSFGYGAQLDSAAIKMAIERARSEHGETRAAEEAVYAGLHYSALRKGTQHGVGVLHAAYGNVRVAQPRNSGNASVAAQREPRLDVPIVFVQFPRAAIDDTSGGWLGYYALDALDYIIDRSKALKQEANAPAFRLCVVLSYGGTAGPHDGDTMLEGALKQRLAAATPDGQLEIVLAAGNNYGKRIHARRHLGVARPGQAFHVHVPPDKPTETFVEIWLPDGRLLPHVTLEVSPPGGAPPQTLALGDGSYLGRPGDVPRAAALFPKRVAQGRNGSMALLAIAPTRLGADSAPTGRWTLAVHCSGLKAGDDLDVHAWIERDDLLSGIRRGQQAHFVDDGSGYVPNVTTPHLMTVDAHTLSSIACIASNHPRCRIVGGYRLSDGDVPSYSSAGPARNNERLAPDLSAPCERGTAVRGLLTGGAFSGSTRVGGGTSVAAPVVARRLLQGASPPRQPAPPPSDRPDLPSRLGGRVD